jgi:hypothetical protein
VPWIRGWLLLVEPLVGESPVYAFGYGSGPVGLRLTALSPKGAIGIMMSSR